ncbi:MAG: phosphoserine phosphatase-like hydrolase, family [Bryobacterales bacterium]|nr:phosphoserine phosphatase-like hydrolase, family [Bryobacterales bacterium]
MSERTEGRKAYLVASDFDQTLSFNDSGSALSELLGVRDFDDKVAGLAKISLVQQGAELAYLLRHDPEFRKVRREHLIEVGKSVRLKENVRLLVDILNGQVGHAQFSFNVISAAPQDVVRSALEGIVEPDHIFGTELEFDERTGEIASISRVAAGFGKVRVLQSLEAAGKTPPNHTIYMGDGSSDLSVMQHVNGYEGYTIAVSEAKYLTRIAKRTVLSSNALSVLVPILEDILHWDSMQIRELFSSYGLTLHEWDRVRTDRLTFHQSPQLLMAEDATPMVVS